MASIPKLYDQIDALSETRTVDELVMRLQPILHELAYYAGTGDGAVMESRETWHSEFTGRLLDAVRQDAAAQKAPSPAARQPGPAARLPGPAAPAEKDRSRRPSKPAAGEHSRQSASRTPKAGRLPPSLQAIMEGTHGSLNDPDD